MVVLCAGCAGHRPAPSFVVATAPTVTVTIAPTTTTERPPPRASRARPTRVTEAIPRVGPSTATDGQLDRLAGCESAGDLDPADGLRINPRATSRNGLYLAAFQFLLSTWHNLGGAGDPRDAPYTEQRDTARRIPLSAWFGQFPHCARQLRRLGVI